MCFLFALICLHSSNSEPTIYSQEKEKKIVWVNATRLTIEGQGWNTPTDPYTRLPLPAKEKVRPPVWALSRDSSGIVIRFNSDSERLEVKWTLRSKNLSMPHMPASGVSGLDLYIKENDQWKWVNNVRPTGVKSQAVLSDYLPKSNSEYALYLPLYNGVSELEIGILEGRSIRSAPKRSKLPIVFYGTSITQGACASRPGMCHVAQLGRRFDRPVINLGFSGNGKMDLELADYLAEIESACYVIDCLPNMNSKDVTKRAEVFVKRLRKLKHQTPILLVEDRVFANAKFKPGKVVFHENNHSALWDSYQKLVEQNVTELYYLKGNQLLGDDFDGTVDGSHPNDLGFYRQTNVFEEMLRTILK